ncbi:hypothetical protein [Kitasatospora sp. MAP5-34]|uniref:hypothetical protein n=1 Tax=Kitasatospora sp. MAP5-34 TaxID=3035102 RepID=UPI00247505EC|nr:hypothetical protein [Kitasatospora sp. MAP5-34]MDH6575824.1 hypothetical protein [Kitasatospora sp. MAP5-34]
MKLRRSIVLSCLAILATATPFTIPAADAQPSAAHSTGAPRAAAATHAGMTWSTAEQRPNGEVHVSYDSQTNGYQGDTPATASLPVLCLDITGSAAPSDITPGFYAGWSKGWVGLTPSVSGTSLTSRAAADALCARSFGTGWRMGEHHDGWYGPGLAYSGGWSFWANGAIPFGTRFWVAINDQPANPWN